MSGMTLNDWRVDIDDRLEDDDPWAAMMARVFALPIGEGGQLAMLRMLRTMSAKSGRSLAVLAASVDALARGESVVQPARPIGIMVDELSAAVHRLSEPDPGSAATLERFGLSAGMVAGTPEGGAVEWSRIPGRREYAGPFGLPPLRVTALEDAVEVSIDGVPVALAGTGQVVVGEPLPEGVAGVTVGADGPMRPAPPGWAPPDHAAAIAAERLAVRLGHRVWLAAGIEADPPMLAVAAKTEREELLREFPGCEVRQLDQYVDGRVWRIGGRMPPFTPEGWTVRDEYVGGGEWVSRAWRGERPTGSRRVYA